MNNIVWIIISFINNFENKKMIDFGKLYCDLHPNEIITNFCLKENCQIGLCATCICTHTQYHINNKTSPEYQNIRTTFSSMHETIRRSINSLESQKNRIDKISEFIHTKRKAVRQNVEQARSETVSLINRFFDNKQKWLLRQMESEEKKLGLHSQGRMESLMNSLTRQTSSLITAAQELNSQNFLESYQRINSQNISNAAKLQAEVSRQLDQNQDFETIINSNEDYLQVIERALDRSLQLSFKMNSATKQMRSSGFQNQNIEKPRNSSILQSPQQQQPFTNTSRFGKMQSSQSTFQRPSQTNIKENNFSSMSFSNVPQIIPERRIQNSEQNTTKSIPISEDQRPTTFQKIPVRDTSSFIHKLNRPQLIGDQGQTRSVYQSQIFRENNQNMYESGFLENQRPNSMKKTSAVNRNHHSQIVVAQKPNLKENQSGSIQGWMKPHQNQSMMMKTSDSNSKDWNMTKESAMQRPSSSSSLPKNSMTGSVIVNPSFVPQNFNLGQFKNSQNTLNVSLENKKIRKSGLTLLKANQANSTSRSKFAVQ